MARSRKDTIGDVRGLQRAIRRLAVCAALLFLTSCQSAETDTQRARDAALSEPEVDYKVIILVIDGPRYTEIFGDPTHAHIPRMWDELRPQGTLFTNFRNEGWTKTVPGHSSVVTGAWQYLDNTGKERPNKPTLFEYYRFARAAPKTDGYVISGKSKLGVCGHSSASGYGASYGAATVAGLSSDLDVYETLIATLQDHRPHVVMACFPAVDLNAHSGVWDDYIAAIEGADSLVANAWAYLQSDSFYAGTTYLFVTADHGRHDDSHGGFTNHGDACEGCRHIFCLALGPDIRQDYTASGPYTQRDIGTTAAAILGIPAPETEGTYVREIFQPLASAILE